MSKALVVIDAQNGFISDATRDLPEKIATYIQQNAFDFVLFTKFVNDEQSGVSRFLGWSKMRTSTETDIHSSLVPLTTPEHVFIKDTYSAFKAFGFTKFLKANNITEITLCGMDTDACVLATYYDGFDLGYSMNMQDELCGSYSGKSLHEAAIQIIDRNLR